MLFWWRSETVNRRNWEFGFKLFAMGEMENFSEVCMDAKAVALRERFERLLKETAEVATELDVVTGALKGVPHYSVIELRAPEIGRQVSQLVPQR